MKPKNNRIDLPCGNFKLVYGRDGVFLANCNDIYVGGALIRYGEFSHLEMRVFEAFTDKDSVVVEIGANIGAHTVGLAKRVKKVIALEPQPQIFYNLCANVALNGLQNVECYNLGAGSTNDVMQVPDLDYSEKNNFGGVSLIKGRGTSVNIVAMDDFPHFAPTFVKIDVEGMELEVLKGYAKTLSIYKPVLYVENDRVEKSKDLIEFLWELGYKMYWDAPYLFNKNNFFGKEENVWPGIVSVNMLCIPEQHPFKTDLMLITDSSKHYFSK